MLTLIRTLQQLANRIDPSINRPEINEATSVELDALELHAKTMLEALQPKAGKRLDGLQLWESLAIAIHHFTTTKRSARLSAADLWDLVKQNCPAYDVDCDGGWAERGAGAVIGLLQSEPAVRKLIEGRGILFWDRWEDSQFRFVDPKWLDSHEDIYRWLTNLWAGGRRCRFCAMVENPMVDELQPIELERRHGVTKIGDMVVLASGSRALTHDRCRPHFIKWLAIAARYSNQAQAEEADKVAGRVSRFEKVVPSVCIEGIHQ